MWKKTSRFVQAQYPSYDSNESNKETKESEAFSTQSNTTKRENGTLERS